MFQDEINQHQKTIIFFCEALKNIELKEKNSSSSFSCQKIWKYKCNTIFYLNKNRIYWGCQYLKLRIFESESHRPYFNCMISIDSNYCSLN